MGRHIGVEVHGIDEIDIGMLLRQCLQSIADVVETIAEVLAAVPGDEHEATAGVEACHVVTACLQRFGKTRVKTRVALLSSPSPNVGIDDEVLPVTVMWLASIFSFRRFSRLSGVGGNCRRLYAPLSRQFISSGHGL